MEAARKCDEARGEADEPQIPTQPEAPGSSETPTSTPEEASSPAAEYRSTTPAASAPTEQTAPVGAPPIPDEPFRPQIDEVLVCSAQGDVLYEWQCREVNNRISFLEFLSQKARQLGQGLPLGDFERLEVQEADARVIAQIQADRALLVRSSMVPTGEAAR